MIAIDIDIDIDIDVDVELNEWQAWAREPRRQMLLPRADEEP